MKRALLWSSLSVGFHVALLLGFPAPESPGTDADSLTMVFTVAEETGEAEEAVEQTVAVAQAAADVSVPEPPPAQTPAPPVPPEPEPVAAPNPVADVLVPQPIAEPEPVALEEPAPVPEQEQVAVLEPPEQPLLELTQAPAKEANAVEPDVSAPGPGTARTDAEERSPEDAAPTGPVDPARDTSPGTVAAAHAGPVTKEADTVPPSLRSGAKPRYPRVARRRGWEGVVLLRVFVATDGQIREVQLEQSSGHDSLDRAALKSIQSWLFHPAQRGQTPVAGELLVPVRFDLVKAG